MTRHRNELAAQSRALFDGTAVGFCVLDGWYYTGSREQLERIACVSIATPTPEPLNTLADCRAVLAGIQQRCTLAGRPKDQAGYCEHCGSGPECIVCERGQP